MDITKIAEIVFYACKGFDGKKKDAISEWQDLSSDEKSTWVYCVLQYEKMDKVPLSDKERMIYFIVKSLR